MTLGGPKIKFIDIVNKYKDLPRVRLYQQPGAIPGEPQAHACPSPPPKAHSSLCSFIPSN